VSCTTATALARRVHRRRSAGKQITGAHDLDVEPFDRSTAVMGVEDLSSGLLAAIPRPRTAKEEPRTRMR